MILCREHILIKLGNHEASIVRYNLKNHFMIIFTNENICLKQNEGKRDCKTKSANIICLLHACGPVGDYILMLSSHANQKNKHQTQILIARSLLAENQCAIVAVFVFHVLLAI